MFLVIAGIHIVLCLGLMGLVLLQQGKGADAGAVMGGGADSLISAGGASSIITKVTTGLAIGFMVTSIILVKFYDRGIVVSDTANPSVLSGSVMDSAVAPAENTEAKPVEETKPAVDPVTK